MPHQCLQARTIGFLVFYIVSFQWCIVCCILLSLIWRCVQAFIMLNTMSSTLCMMKLLKFGLVVSFLCCIAYEYLCHVIAILSWIQLVTCESVMTLAWDQCASQHETSSYSAVVIQWLWVYLCTTFLPACCTILCSHVTRYRYGVIYIFMGAISWFMILSHTCNSLAWHVACCMTMCSPVVHCIVCCLIGSVLCSFATYDKCDSHVSLCVAILMCDVVCFLLCCYAMSLLINVFGC